MLKKIADKAMKTTLKHFFFGIIPSIAVVAITTMGVSNHLCKTNNYFFVII